MIQRSFRYRLYPTAEQAERLSQFVGATRFVYNLALDQRRTFGRRGRSFNFANQGREVTQLRREIDWIGAVPCSALTQALRDLDKAFSAFFAGRARYPSPRKRGVNDSFRCQAHDSGFRRINHRWGALRVPNLGWVRLRLSRDICGRWMNVTISRVAGQWFASLACEIEHITPANSLPAVGIDRGIANTLALSTGEMMSLPSMERLERQKRRAQRILSRRKRDSNRYRKQRRRVAAIAARVARIRADWRHKATTLIAERFGTAVVEDLNVLSMSTAGKHKRGLNRAIREQGWAAFATVLQYKLEERGGALVKVNPAYTSQTCAACGVVDRASRESQSRFACRHCGTEDHADVNAAKVILRRSTAGVEGGGCAPDEARTEDQALAA